MDPLFNILKYEYDKKGKKLENISSISDFYDNGSLFPEFVDDQYREESRKENQNPEKSPKGFQSNFIRTIDFLQKSDNSYKQFRYSQTSKEREKLLITIFRKKIFSMTDNEIFQKANTIFKSKNMQFIYLRDMYSGRFLISLLHILTDDKVENVKKVNEQVDFDTKIIPSLEKSGIPICINRKSFNRDNHDIFLIQIQIIFEIYSEKIKQILKNEESKKATDINSDNLDSLTNAINYIIDNPEKKITSLNELGTKIDLLVFVVHEVSEIPFDLEKVDEPEKILNTLFLYDKKFKTRKINFKSDKSCKVFFDLLFSYFYFNETNIKKMLAQINSIFYDYNLEISNFDDFSLNKIYLFLPLLQRYKLVTSHELRRDIYPQSDISYEKLRDIFNDFNVPFILDKQIVTGKAPTNMIMFQAKIILDKFEPNYLNKITKDYPKPKIDINSQNFSEIQPLLLILNVIGSRSGLRFSSPKDIFNLDIFQFFIETLLDISLNYHISIGKNHDQNIENIIDYLGTQNKIFKFLNLNFDDPELKEISANSFCIKLLNLYFVKKSKAELYNRCNSIIGYKCNIKTPDDFYNGVPFFYLLQFLIKGNTNIVVDEYLICNIDKLIEYFNMANVPIVINSKTICAPRENEHFILYQLQLYFDILDEVSNSSKKHLIVSKLFLASLNSFFKLRFYDNMKDFVLTVKVKNDYSKNANFLRRFNSSHENIKKVDSQKNKTGPLEAAKLLKDEMRKLRKSNEEYKKKLKDDVKNVFKTKQELINVWNSTNHNFIEFENELIYKSELLSVKGKETVNKVEYFQNVTSDVKKHKLKLCEMKIVYPSTIKSQSTQQKLYKIFLYVEEKQRWEFNQKDFDLFIDDFGYNTSELSTILVSYINSFHNDLIFFNYNLLNYKYPALEDDSIYVYALSPSLYSNKIKPMILALHIPHSKSEMANITTIITQIYTYLFTISNFQIVLLNNNNNLISDQIESTKIIYNFSKSLNLHLNKSKLLFFLNAEGLDYSEKNNNDFNDKSLLFQSLKNDLPTLKIVPIAFNCIQNNFKDCLGDQSTIYQSLKDLSLKLVCIPHYQLSGLYFMLKVQQPEKLDDYLNTIINLRISDLNDKNSPNLNSNDKNSPDSDSNDKNSPDSDSNDKKSSDPDSNDKKSSDPDSNDKKSSDPDSNDKKSSDPDSNEKKTSDPDLILLDEFSCFTPELDHEFQQKYRHILYSRLQNGLKISTSLKEKLNFITGRIFEKLKEFINSKIYLEPKDFAIIKTALVSYYDEAYYMAIFDAGFGRIADLVFLDNLKMLETKKNRDLAQIKINSLNKKEIHKDLNKDIKSSPNYVIKEVENVRDTEIVVDFDKEIKTEIPQDF